MNISKVYNGNDLIYIKKIFDLKNTIYYPNYNNMNCVFITPIKNLKKLNFNVISIENGYGYSLKFYIRKQNEVLLTLSSSGPAQGVSKKIFLNDIPDNADNVVFSNSDANHWKNHIYTIDLENKELYTRQQWTVNAGGYYSWKFYDFNYS